MTFQAQIDGPIASPDMRESALIHCSKSLNPPYRERFLARLKVELPGLHAFVEHETQRLPKHRSPGRDVVAHGLRVRRGIKWQMYARRLRRAEAR